MADQYIAKHAMPLKALPSESGNVELKSEMRNLKRKSYRNCVSILAIERKVTAKSLAVNFFFLVFSWVTLTKLLGHPELFMANAITPQYTLRLLLVTHCYEGS